MERSFFKGFTVYRNSNNPVYVAPHCGPALEVPTIRDENSDTVASLCWLKTGGSLVLSNLTRKRVWGIDLNRDPPSKELALKMYPEFMADKNPERLKRFRAKYAFVARSNADYNERVRIYENFWGTVGNLGSVIIMVHRKYARMKNYPSVMDIVTYEGKGVDTETIRGVINEINKKYGKKLKGMARQYKNYVLQEEARVCSRIKSMFGSFTIGKLGVEHRTWLEQDIVNIKKFADKELRDKLKGEFSEATFMAALRNALRKKISPMITLENFFKGRKALSVKSRFFKKHLLVMEVEVNAFLGYWYSSLASDIIVDIVTMLRGAKLYQKLGIKQTRMEDFL